MKILNLMWGFNLGGIGKCFLTYAKLGETDPRLEIRTVCINLQNIQFDLSPLHEIGAETIDIRNRRDISWIGKLRKLLKDYQPDAVFTHGFNGPVLILIERLLGDRTPLLCSYHGEYHAPTQFRRLLEPVFNSTAHLIYKSFASGVLTVCDHSSRFLQTHGVPSNKIQCVHNGLPDQALSRGTISRPDYCANQVILGVSSRLDPVKGIEDLLDAMALLKDLPIHLLILGKGLCEDLLKKQTIQLNLSNKVSFLGYQSNVSDWLQVFDIFMLPSHAEYHSIALLEAMRAGLPIVATDVGGNGESVRDRQEALLVPPREPEALAKAIRELASDPELRAKLGQNARKRFLAEFTEAQMCRNLADWLLRFDKTQA